MSFQFGPEVYDGRHIRMPVPNSSLSSSSRAGALSAKHQPGEA